MVTTFGTGRVSDEAIVKAVREVFDLTPAGIIRDLKLRRPIYTRTAAYGHFGRCEPGFTWEELNRVAAVRRAVGWPRADSATPGLVGPQGQLSEKSRGGRGGNGVHPIVEMPAQRPAPRVAVRS